MGRPAAISAARVRTASVTTQRGRASHRWACGLPGAVDTRLFRVERSMVRLPSFIPLYAMRPPATSGRSIVARGDPVGQRRRNAGSDMIEADGTRSHLAEVGWLTRTMAGWDG